WGIEATERLDRASDQDADHIALASLCRAYGNALLRAGHTGMADAALKRSLKLFQDAGQIRSVAIVKSDLGDILVQRGDLAGAQTNYEEYLRIMREVGDPRSEGVALSLLGDILVQRGDLAGAQTNYEEYLRIMREVGDTRGEGVALFNIGQVAEAREQWDVAEHWYRLGLAIVREADDALNEARASEMLAGLLLEHRPQSSDGCALLQRAITLYHQMELPDEERARETALRLGCATTA
ncbi:MAG: tetratricopeptide repeat protein, partial [Ktedonobacterales bacterium]